MPAITIPEKLALLASFKGVGDAGTTMGKKLNVDRNDDSWSIVSGLKAAFNRRDDDSLTSFRVIRSIGTVFGLEFQQIPKENIDAIQIPVIEQRLLPVVKAYRGFYYLVQNGYANKKNNPSGSTGEEWTRSLNKCLLALGRSIEHRVEALVKAKMPTQNYCPFKQEDFFPVETDLNKGQCWGITALWLARCLTENKIQYHRAGESHEYFIQRIQKKALKIHALQESQNAIRSGGSLSPILEREVIVKTASMFNLIQKYRNFHAQPIMNQLNAIRSHNSANNINDRHATAHDAIQKKINQWGKLTAESTINQNISKISMSLGVESCISDPIELLFRNMRGRVNNTKQTGFIVSFGMKKEITEDLGLGTRSEHAGHALGVFFDTDNKVFFIDPNYGEWAGSEHEIKKVMARVLASYTFGWTINELDFTKFEGQEIDDVWIHRVHADVPAPDWLISSSGSQG